MKRKTRYYVKVILNADSYDCEKIPKKFSTIRNVRKFIQKYSRQDFDFCWRDTSFRNKDRVRMDSYYAFDWVHDSGKYWHRLNK